MRLPSRRSRGVGSHRPIGTTNVLAGQPDPIPADRRGPRLATLTSWPVLLGGSVGLALVSLLVLPHGIAYDPWSWLIWGREILHLQLDTTDAATAVKPLAIFIDTALAPFGSAAPVLWLLIARSASLLSIALVFRVGCRLGGLSAGLVAAIGFAVCNQFLSYLFISGMSEPMASAAVLAAVDSQMSARPRWVLVSLVAAGLLRPEAWPFLIGYCGWLAYRSAGWRRAVAAGLAVGVPAVWFVIDWFGSRQLFRSAGAATHQSQGGPLLSRQPGLATIRETWHLMSGPVVVLFLLGLGAALLAWRRDGRASATAWIGLAAIGWLVVDAVLAQGRFATGAPRYLLPGVALACVVAGVFVADVGRALPRWFPNPRVATAAAIVGCLALVAVATPRLSYTGRGVHVGVARARQLDQLATALPHAIALAGGRVAVVRCGQVSTQAFQVPLVAWQLRVPVGHVGIMPAAPGTVLRQSGAPTIPVTLGDDYRLLGAVGPTAARWVVLTTCPRR